MLALGVALDALVGSRNGLPGRVIVLRCALLEADPSARLDKRDRHNDVYSVHSAPAYGGEPSRLRQKGFVRSVSEDVRWAAQRPIALSGRFSISSEDDPDGRFDSLALGGQTW
jgi:hypothetical protein